MKQLLRCLRLTLPFTHTSLSLSSCQQKRTSPQGTSGDPEEHALVVRIENSLRKTLDLTAEHVPTYERAIEDYIQSNPPSITDQRNDYGEPILPPARKWLQDEHTLLSEKLMQALLFLDGVVCKPTFEVARAKRREAVKETQRLMDLIDQMNDRVKACDKAATEP